MTSPLPFALISAALLLSGCSSAPQALNGTEFATRLPDRPGLERLAQVAPGVYRGAQPGLHGYEELQRMGIKTVISFRRLANSRARAEAAGLDYVAIPIHASIGSTPPSDEEVELFFKTVLDPAKQPVFIHCKFGRDRAGLMTALYRIEVEGWDNDRAVDEMMEFGFREFYHDLLTFVQDFRAAGLSATDAKIKHFAVIDVLKGDRRSAVDFSLHIIGIPA